MEHEPKTAVKPLDPRKLRGDFPILSRTVRGKRLVYLDNAATTQKPLPVLKALDDFYRLSNANVHRGVHFLSEESTRLMEEARAKVARFIGAPDPATVIFTKNTTESINLVAYSWARRTLKPGDEILLTEMEHHSNLVPWQLAARDTGATLRFIPVNEGGELDLSSLDSLLSSRTKLLAVTQMSNVLGTINPVAELARKAHAAGALVLVDAAQSAPHMPVDVLKLEADFVAFSAHKMMGPMGVGVLWGRREILEKMDPFLGGGDMISSVTLESSAWNELPYKFEGGTPNAGDVVAFGAAVDYLQGIGLDAVLAHERELTSYLLEQLPKQIPDAVIYGPRALDRRGGAVSFNLPGIHAHDVGTVVDQDGVAIRVGHHCCQPLMRKFGVPGTARASFYVYNDRDDADSLIAALKKVESLFRSPARKP